MDSGWIPSIRAFTKNTSGTLQSSSFHRRRSFQAPPAAQRLRIPRRDARSTTQKCQTRSGRIANWWWWCQIRRFRPVFYCRCCVCAIHISLGCLFEKRSRCFYQRRPGKELVWHHQQGRRVLQVLEIYSSFAWQIKCERNIWRGMCIYTRLRNLTSLTLFFLETIARRYTQTYLGSETEWKVKQLGLWYDMISLSSSWLLLYTDLPQVRSYNVKLWHIYVCIYILALRKEKQEERGSMNTAWITTGIQYKKTDVRFRLTI